MRETCAEGGIPAGDATGATGRDLATPHRIVGDGLDHPAADPRRADRRLADRALQPARPVPEPRRQRVGPDRGAAQAAVGPDPEPRRDGAGLRGARARHVRGRDAGPRRGADRAGPRRDRGGGGHPRPGARTPVRRRRGVPGAAGRRELPPAADGAVGDGEPDRGLAPGLQRHGADVQQLDPDVPGACARGAVRVHEAGVLRDRRDAARATAGRLLAAAPARPLRPCLPPRPPSPTPAARARPVARPRGALALAATVVAALTLTGVAQGQTYELVSSDVTATVRADGSVAVDEAITVAFSGSFTYGYREIPYRSGERIDEIGVSENGKPFGPGAPTDLEPGGPAGTFGVDDLGGRVRIVWRFQSDGVQQRTFLVHYRMTGLAVGYDDVVDVNLKVWGDEWKQRLGAPDRDDARARRRRPRLGPPGLGPRRRHAPGEGGAAPGARHRRGSVRRAPRALSTGLVHVHGGHARSRRQRAGEDRRRGAGGRASVRAGQGAHRRRDRPPVAQRADRARARSPPRARDRDVRVLALRAGARDRLRPRVRAGAADRHAGRARADAPPSGRGGGLLRVHGDPLRPDQTWPLLGPARHDRAQRLGRPPPRERRRPRALRRQAGRADALGEVGGVRRRPRPRREQPAPVRVPRGDRGRALDDGAAVRGLQGGGRDRGRRTGAGSGRWGSCR